MDYIKEDENKQKFPENYNSAADNANGLLNFIGFFLIFLFVIFLIIKIKNIVELNEQVAKLEKIVETINKNTSELQTQRTILASEIGTTIFESIIFISVIIIPFATNKILKATDIIAEEQFKQNNKYTKKTFKETENQNKNNL
ncbi:MAG: hypothetical protein IJ538_03795 [Clostridia bacterium]|nr:hypothetical protein [Clostridia bacterium]